MLAGLKREQTVEADSRDRPGDARPVELT